MPPPLDYAKVMMHLLHNEPLVHAALHLLQSHCLRQGVTVSNATPLFVSHVEEHYARFCSDALEACLAVGFVPFRVYTTAGGTRIPEVLPLGSYTWTVLPQTAQNRPLLHYDVRCHTCKETVHVYEYVTPRLYYKCVSPLSTLLDAHSRLLVARACADAANVWNSHPNLAFEYADRTQINELAKTGATLQNPVYYQQSENAMQAGQAHCTLAWLHSTRAAMQLPDAAALVVAPHNTVLRPLPSAQAPADMAQQELAFGQAVALATGVPLALLLPASGNKERQQDDTARDMLLTCRALCTHLVRLLQMAYGHLYPDSKTEPAFVLIPEPPLLLSPEQLVPLYDSQLISDKAFSGILKTNLGTELATQQANQARKQRTAPKTAA